MPKTERRWLFWPLQKTILIFSPSKHPPDQHKTIARMKEHQILYRMVHKRQNLGVPELLQKSPGNPHLRFQSKRLVLRFALLCCFPRKNYVKETRTMVFGVEESFYQTWAGFCPDWFMRGGLDDPCEGVGQSYRIPIKIRISRHSSNRGHIQQVVWDCLAHISGWFFGVRQNTPKPTNVRKQNFFWLDSVV